MRHHVSAPYPTSRPSLPASTHPSSPSPSATFTKLIIKYTQEPHLLSAENFFSNPHTAYLYPSPRLTQLHYPTRERERGGERQRVMAKRLRMRISRVLPSFQSCRNQEEDPALRPAAFCLSPINPKALDDDFPPPPRPSPTRPRASRGHAPVVSLGCGRRPAAIRHSPYYISAYDADADADDLPLARETPAYLWRKEEKWHIVACADDSPRLKIDSDDSGAMFFHPPTATRLSAKRREAELRGRRRRGSRTTSYRSRVSTSSADSGWFSSEDEANDEWEGYDADTKDDDDDRDGDEDETATLVSSYRSVSTKSSSLAPKPTRRSRNGRSPERTAALHGLGKGATPAQGKVKESFAVVKRSEDPRGDFKRSMVEMVVEKEIYNPEDLEQLLHCFLSLNSRCHHAAIVSAFSEIWDALFPATPAN